MQGQHAYPQIQPHQRPQRDSTDYRIHHRHGAAPAISETATLDSTSWTVTYLRPRQTLPSTPKITRNGHGGWQKHKSPHIVSLEYGSGSSDDNSNDSTNTEKRFLLCIRESTTNRIQELVELGNDEFPLDATYVTAVDGEGIIRFSVGGNPVRKFAVIADSGRGAATLCQELCRRAVKVRGMDDLPEALCLRGNDQRTVEALEANIPSLSRPEVQAYVVRLLFQDSFHGFVRDLSEMFCHVQTHLPSLPQRTRPSPPPTVETAQTSPPNPAPMQAAARRLGTDDVSTPPVCLRPSSDERSTTLDNPTVVPSAADVPSICEGTGVDAASSPGGVGDAVHKQVDRNDARRGVAWGEHEAVDKATNSRNADKYAVNDRGRAVDASALDGRDGRGFLGRQQEKAGGCHGIDLGNGKHTFNESMEDKDKADSAAADTCGSKNSCNEVGASHGDRGNASDTPREGGVTRGTLVPGRRRRGRPRKHENTERYEGTASAAERFVRTRKDGREGIMTRAKGRNSAVVATRGKGDRHGRRGGRGGRDRTVPANESALKRKKRPVSSDGSGEVDASLPAVAKASATSEGQTRRAMSWPSISSKRQRQLPSDVPSLPDEDREFPMTPTAPSVITGGESDDSQRTPVQLPTGIFVANRENTMSTTDSPRVESARFDLPGCEEGEGSTINRVRDWNPHSGAPSEAAGRSSDRQKRVEGTARDPITSRGKSKALAPVSLASPASATPNVRERGRGGRSTVSRKSATGGKASAGGGGAVVRGKRGKKVDGNASNSTSRRNLSISASTGAPGAVSGRAVGLSQLLKQTWSRVNKHPSAWAFRVGVNTALVPDYLDVVKHPIDLSSIKERLDNDTHYMSTSMLYDDLVLMCQNALVYNPRRSSYYSAAQDLLDFINSMEGPAS